MQTPNAQQTELGRALLNYHRSRRNMAAEIYESIRADRPLKECPDSHGAWVELMRVEVAAGLTVRDLIVMAEQTES
jgi:hypothetical protein